VTGVGAAALLAACESPAPTGAPQPPVAPLATFRAPASAAREARYVEGQVLVRLRPSAVARAPGVHGRVGARVLRQLRGGAGPRGALQLVSLPAGLSVEEAVRAYRALPEVAHAEPNFLLHLDRLPDDPRLGELWGLHNPGTLPGSVAGVDIGAAQAWALTTGRSDVVVAVLDSGVDATHPDLAPNMWVNPGEGPVPNGRDDDGNGYVDDIHGADAVHGVGGGTVDLVGHGTHVAGTIAARGDDGAGVAGVSWRASLLTCRIFGEGRSGDVADAIECLDYVTALKTRAVNPVDVVAVNASWGGTDFSAELRDAVARLHAAGVLLVAAAGNGGFDGVGDDLEAEPHYPASLRLPNVLAVAAHDAAGRLAGFSNVGRLSVHLAAPGVDVLSTWPGGGHRLASGTSMAAPHVTGVLALLKAQEPSRTGRELRSRLLAGVEPVAALAPVTLTGGRLRAAGPGDTVGALTCEGRSLQRGLLAPGTPRYGISRLPAAGGAVRLSALDVGCGPTAVPLTLTSSRGEPVPFADDGQGGDAHAGDGIATASWSPAAPGGHRLTFPGGQELYVSRARPDGTAPTVGTLTAPPGLVEGGLARFEADFADPAHPADPAAGATALWHFDLWREAQAQAGFSQQGLQGPVTPGQPFSREHRYAESGEYFVGLLVLGADGVAGPERTVVVSVSNAPPVVTAVTASAARVREGVPVDFDAAFSDPGTLDAPWTAEWDFDGGDGALSPDARSTSFALQHPLRTTHAFADQGRYAVRVQVTDGDLDAPATSAPASLLVEVVDAEPDVSALRASADTLVEGAAVDLSVEAAASPADPVARFRWDLDGDGSFEQVTAEGRLRHTFRDNAPGGAPWRVRVRVEDEDGFVEREASVQVLNAPPRFAEPFPDPVTLAPGETLAHPLQVEDADPVSFTVLRGPEGLGVSAAGVLQWTPTPAQRGAQAHLVTVRAADTDGASAEVTLAVRALAPEAEPPAAGGCATAGAGAPGVLGVLLLVLARRRRKG
jgi:uncharacterized protein (TIGR03382 family)